MKSVMHQSEVQAQKVEMEGVENVTIQWLITEEQGAKNFAMRRFVIGPGGHTPLHKHDWEHEVYVESGNGSVKIGELEHPLKSGSFVFVPGEIMHCFSSEHGMIFLCMIPHKR